jgi:hypothetical protein
VKPDTELPIVQGVGDSKGLPIRAYSVPAAGGLASDCPELGENPLFLFTLAYSELIEAIADTLFPPNTVSDLPKRHNWPRRAA